MLKVYGKRVIAVRVGSDKINSTGVRKTSSNKEKPLIVKVVSSGISDISQEERVLIARYSGMEIDFEDNSYIILNQDDILATLGVKDA